MTTVPSPGQGHKPGRGAPSRRLCEERLAIILALADELFAACNDFLELNQDGYLCRCLTDKIRRAERDGDPDWYNAELAGIDARVLFEDVDGLRYNLSRISSAIECNVPSGVEEHAARLRVILATAEGASTRRPGKGKTLPSEPEGPPPWREV